jgi:hypothetical protein
LNHKSSVCYPDNKYETELHTVLYLNSYHFVMYSHSLQTGSSGNLMLVGARFSAPIETGPGAHPVSCTMGTGSLSWG